MKIKELKWSLGGKIAMQVLFFVMVVTCVLSLFGMVFMGVNGAYDGQRDKVEEVSFFSRYFYNDAYTVVYHYEEFIDADEPDYQAMDRIFDPALTNYSCRILSDDWGSENAGDDWLLYESPGVDEAQYCGSSWTGDYLVEAYLNPELSANDKYQALSAKFDVLYEMRWALIAIAPASFLLGIVLLIFMVRWAGRRKGVEGIVPNGMDKIPLDLYAAVMGFLIGFSLYFSSEISYDILYTGSVFYVILSLFGLLAAYLCFMALFLSVVTRIKLGKWWRNTLIFRACTWIKSVAVWLARWVKQTLAPLPLMWKVIAGFGVFELANFLFIIQVYSLGGLMPVIALLWLVLQLALAVALIEICNQLLILKDAGETIAEGEHLELDLPRLRLEQFRQHGENLTRVRDGMDHAIEEQMKSERLKTELITNVSHDIKTPLTSIINYVDLLKQAREEETREEYLEVLDKHAKRLKKLTEDLLEVSKVSTGNVAVALEDCDFRESILQAVGEYSQRLESAGLVPVITTPEEEVMIQADGRLLWRVMDNLLSNVCKYSLAGTRVYLNLSIEEDNAVLSVKNVSREPLNVAPDELMERFVRGDDARSTEGSGLGLSIAQNLVELQRGAFALAIDGDLFKAEVFLPLTSRKDPLNS